MKLIKDHTNEVYGRLTVIKFIERKDCKSYWKCKCNCGNEIVVPITYLTSGDTRSCGCLKKEIVRNRSKNNSFIKNHRLYTIWIDMRRRCSNRKIDSYIYYGEKGISVCDEWENDFKKFQEWAFKNGYNDNLTIDRIDVNGNYEPSNCRWTTKFEQNNNMSTNHKIIYKNKEYNSMSSFCREFKLDYNTFREKIRRGCSVEEALIKSGVK